MVIEDATIAVPNHERFAFAARQHAHCVLVFCVNEGPRVQRQLARMAPLREHVDIVIADGGSTDGSLDKEVLEAMGVRALLIMRDAGGLSAQMRMGLWFALREGYDGVVVMDGNDKDDSSVVPEFLAQLRGGMDHVQGSRYMDGGRSINTPVLRMLGGRLLHAPLISLAARHRYTDTTNGFRAYSRRLLEDPRVVPFRGVFQYYELHYYLAIRAARLGFRVGEVPVTRTYPREGSVPTKIRGLKGNLGILITLIRAVLGSYNP